MENLLSEEAGDFFILGLKIIVKFKSSINEGNSILVNENGVHTVS
jgi:hypothetical protein